MLKQKLNVRLGPFGRESETWSDNCQLLTNAERVEENSESEQLITVEGDGGDVEENHLLDSDGLVNLSAVRRGDKKHLNRYELMPSKKLALALLYLALLYSGQTVLVVELIRWGKIL